MIHLLSKAPSSTKVVGPLIEKNGLEKTIEICCNLPWHVIYFLNMNCLFNLLICFSFKYIDLLFL